MEEIKRFSFCEADIWDPSACCVPYISLTKREAFDFFHYFLPLISGYSTLTPHLCRPVNAEGRCRRWVPYVSFTAQESFDFSDYFFTPDFWVLDF